MSHEKSKNVPTFTYLQNRTNTRLPDPLVSRASTFSDKLACFSVLKKPCMHIKFQEALASVG